MTDLNHISSAKVERHINQVIGDADKFNLPIVQDVLQEPRDRWYGQLVMSVYNSLSDTQDPETALPAAAAIELLRESVRLRSRLLITLTDKHAHTLTLDPTAALLAADYLYTSAFSSLRSVPDSSAGDCFEILTTVLKTTSEAFARSHTSAISTNGDQTNFLDETAGSLGEGATTLGATLAGFDESDRLLWERVGHGLSLEREINRILETSPNEAIVIPPTFNESQYQLHAEQWRDDADQALDTLSETLDLTRLRAFVETTLTR